MRFILGILIGMMGCVLASAQVTRDSVKIYFHQGKHKLDSTFVSNKQTLEWIDCTVLQVYKIEVVGGASPEGSVSLNKRLSEKRAKVLFDYLSRYGQLPDSLKTTRFVGRDWQGLLRLVKADHQVPYQQESIELIEQIIREVESGVKTKIDPFWRLTALCDGKPYRYMYKNLFPELRASTLLLWFREKPQLVHQELPSLKTDMPALQPLSPVVVPQPTSVYWAIKTNALYDVLAVPNIGAELYVGDGWSVGTNWMYAWWKHDHKHWYWRIYGGDLYVRKWFGKQAKEKPLSGHHVGLYAQALTYDFATGGRGYMGGKPGGTIFDKASYAIGLEYGYSLPLAHRLNLDLSVGLGYLSGQYQEYLPQDDCYVWQSTKHRKWFGPIKAEVSLVYLLGRYNYNKGKGGSK